MIQLRPVLPEDVKYFARWWRDEDLIALTSGNFSSLPDGQLEKYFQNLLAQQSRVDRIIELDGQPIGHMSAQERAEGWWELQIIIGEKEYWGKGYGPDAIGQFLDELRTRKTSKVYLEVRPENIRAISAYEKCGFVAVSRASHHNPNQPETIRMELII